MMEWRECIGLPGYEVSECGDLRNTSTGFRHRGFIDPDGYLGYAVTKESGEKTAVKAHRLVAMAFIGDPPTDRHEVAHNNGSRVMNHYSNLRWATRKENHGDIQKHGTSPAKGERNPKAKLTDDQVREIRRRYNMVKNRLSSEKISSMAEEFNIHHSQICRIVKGKAWSHIGMEEHLEGR